MEILSDVTFKGNIELESLKFTKNYLDVYKGMWLYGRIECTTNSSNERCFYTTTPLIISPIPDEPTMLDGEKLDTTAKRNLFLKLYYSCADVSTPSGTFIKMNRLVDNYASVANKYGSWVFHQNRGSLHLSVLGAEDSGSMWNGDYVDGRKFNINMHVRSRDLSTRLLCLEARTDSLNDTGRPTDKWFPGEIYLETGEDKDPECVYLEHDLKYNNNLPVAASQRITNFNQIRRYITWTYDSPEIPAGCSTFEFVGNPLHDVDKNHIIQIQNTSNHHNVIAETWISDNRVPVVSMTPKTETIAAGAYQAIVI